MNSYENTWGDTMGEPFPVPETPTYEPEGILRPTVLTPAHAEMFNGIFQRLIGNTHAAKLAADGVRIDLDALRAWLEAQLGAFDLRLRSIEDAVLTNVTSNPFSIRFDNLDGVVVTGVWNEPLQRMEC